LSRVQAKDLIMKVVVITTEGHEGKILEMNTEQEVVTLHGVTGETLGSLSWGAVIEQILASDDDVRFAHARSHPRAPLAVKVRYTTPEGKQFDSLTGGIGAGGLFIESSAPLAPGTELSVEFALPDHPWEKHKAKAKVAWTRNKPERHLLFPGMGVQFTNIDEKARKELVELVDALNRSRLAT
jgi:type IV pilus assembly protein PilZ